MRALNTLICEHIFGGKWYKNLETNRDRILVVREWIDLEDINDRDFAALLDTHYEPTEDMNLSEGWGNVRLICDNLATVGKLIEKLMEDYHLKMKTPFEKGSPFYCGITPLGMTGWNGRGDFEAMAPTLPIAIGLAALKTKGIDATYAG